MDLRGSKVDDILRNRVSAEQQEIVDRQQQLVARQNFHDELSVQAELLRQSRVSPPPERTIALVDDDTSPIGLQARWCNPSGQMYVALELVGQNGINDITGRDHNGRILVGLGSIYVDQPGATQIVIGTSEPRAVTEFFDIKKDEQGEFSPVAKEGLSENEVVALACYEKLIDILGSLSYSKKK